MLEESDMVLLEWDIHDKDVGRRVQVKRRKKISTKYHSLIQGVSAFTHLMASGVTLELESEITGPVNKLK